MVIVAGKGSVGWLSRQDAMPRVNLIGVSDVTRAFILSAQIYRGAQSLTQDAFNALSLSP
jgi:hypothetical protein